MFRVEFIKSGFKHDMKYPKSFAAAITAASSKGFNKSSDCWDSTPHYSRIYEKSQNGNWILIANVDEGGCRLIPTEDRADYKSLEAKRVEVVALQDQIRENMKLAQVIINGNEGRK